MLFLRLGIRRRLGHAPVIARSKPGPLGENQDPTTTKHAARGRGACPASAIASGNSAAHVGTHRKHQGRWEFGEHEPFGEVCGVGGCPVFNRLLLEPAAARTSCSMVQNSKDDFATGQRGADGKRAVASATTSILRKAPKKKNAPHPPKHRQSLCPHPRGTCKYRHAQKTPRGLGGMGNFSLKAWTGGVGLAWLTVGLVRGRWGNTPPGGRCTQLRNSRLHRMLTRLGVCPHGPWLIAR